MEEMKVLLCSADADFCARVEQALALWQEELCVRCATERLDYDALARHEGAICFLDLTDAASCIEPDTPSSMATVVTAANDAQAIESYRRHPTAFLSADFGYAEFCEAMGRCYPFWRQYLQWLELSFHRETVRVPLCRLSYAEADGRETALHCGETVLRASAPLGKVAEQLPAALFLRCQKSFIVNVSAIRAISGGSVVMADGRSIPMARARVRELTNAVAAWRAARETERKAT